MPKKQQMSDRQVNELRYFAREAADLLKRAKWHMENRDASKAFPAEWDNSATHISNLAYIFITNAEHRAEKIINDNDSDY